MNNNVPVCNPFKCFLNFLFFMQWLLITRPCCFCWIRKMMKISNLEAKDMTWNFVHFVMLSEYLMFLYFLLLTCNIIDQSAVEPGPNGLGIYLWLCLSSLSVHLRWLATTWAHFGQDQICMEVKASLNSSFGHPTQVNESWVTSINLLLANETEDSLP